MPRVRIHFCKGGYASFISHLDLPMLFSRAAARAGLRMEMTQGFSPHPRLALGPPLPVGVVGLNEPADFWFAEWDGDSLTKWRRRLPEGIGISSAVPADGVSLNKLCGAASYIIEPRGDAPLSGIAGAIEATLRDGGALLSVCVLGGEVRVSSSELERCGPSRMVRDLVSSGLISGWGDLSIVRAAVGRWDPDGMRVIPLTEECPL
jgi:hypothetical protein